MSNDKAMVKLEELYKLAIEIKDIEAGLLAVAYMIKLGDKNEK